MEEGIIGIGPTVAAALRAFDTQYLIALRPPNKKATRFDEASAGLSKWICCCRLVQQLAAQKRWPCDRSSIGADVLAKLSRSAAVKTACGGGMISDNRPEIMMRITRQKGFMREDC
jgi:hypothetical protein